MASHALANRSLLIGLAPLQDRNSVSRLNRYLPCWFLAFYFESNADGIREFCDAENAERV